MVLSSAQSTFAPSARVAGPHTQMQQMRKAVARYAAMSALTQLTAAKNEQAIADSLPQLAPLRPFFGALYIRGAIDAPIRSRDDFDDPQSAAARERRAGAVGELGEVTQSERPNSIALMQQGRAGQSAAP